jgi:PII-like signaling protein
MKGYQISFFAEQGQRIEGKLTTEWLMHLAKSLGITGTTTLAGIESFGTDGRRHSARFFELSDQPVEILMAVTEQQADALFEKIKITDTRMFYIKMPVEYGELGTKATSSV